MLRVQEKEEIINKLVLMIFMEEEWEEIEFPTRKKKYIARYKKGRIYSKGKLVIKSRKK